MKKYLLALGCLGLTACYYAVPAQDMYVEEVYSEPAYQTYYSGYSAQQTIYTTPAAASSVVYVERSPEIVYVNDPLISPPVHYHHSHPRSHGGYYPHHEPHHPKPSSQPHKAHVSPSHHGSGHVSGKPERLPQSKPHKH